MRILLVNYRYFVSGGPEKYMFNIKKILEENGVKAEVVEKIWEGAYSILSLIQTGKVDFIIKTPTKGKKAERDGFKIRRAAVECKIPCFTSLDTANALYMALSNSKKIDIVDITKI